MTDISVLEYMKTPFIFRQHTWLIETIKREKKVSLARLSALWQETEMSGGMPLARTTFNRHKDDIQDMFGVIIECDRKNRGRYYIFNDHVLDENTVQNWMFSTLSVNNLLTENNGLYDRILLEAVPSADVHLRTIIQAMRETRQIQRSYNRYGAAAAKSFVACPCCLKMYSRRWYALMSAKTEKTKEPCLLVFSLDRIGQLEILPDKFTLPEGFDAAAFFDECFGVVIGDGTEPTTIRLRAFGRERFSLQDLPIHHTQKLIAEGEDYCDFEVTLRPTSDFKAFLLSKAEWLIALSPRALAEEIVASHRAAASKYEQIGIFL